MCMCVPSVLHRRFALHKLQRHTRDGGETLSPSPSIAFPCSVALFLAAAAAFTKNTTLLPAAALAARSSWAWASRPRPTDRPTARPTATASAMQCNPDAAIMPRRLSFCLCLQSATALVREKRKARGGGGGRLESEGRPATPRTLAEGRKEGRKEVERKKGKKREREEANG